MTFSEKLNSILNLTGMSSSVLSNRLHMDKSNISRLKTGVRGMPKPPVIRQMAEIFASSCTQMYQFGALDQLVHDARLHQSLSSEQLTDILYEWLLKPDDIAMDNRIQAPTPAVPNITTSFEQANSIQKKQPDSDNIRCFFGVAGKQEAMSAFLDFILNEISTPSLIQMFSDESTFWCTENQTFEAEINRKMRQLANIGFHFEHIANPINSLDCLIKNIERWLPFYTTDSISEYYYPCMRDELHRRMLFLVPGKIALTSCSLSGEQECGITMLSTEPELLKYYSNDFVALLSRCKPTAKTFTTSNMPEIFELLTAECTAMTSKIHISNTLPAFTIPSALLDKLRSIRSADAIRLVNLYEQHIFALSDILAQNSVVDIIYLPPEKDVMNYQIPLPESSLLPRYMIRYTPDEYILHLQNIVHYLDLYPNYHVVLSDRPYFNNTSVYASENEYVLIARDEAPYTLYSINSSEVLCQYFYYLKYLSKSSMDDGYRAEVRTRLMIQITHLQKLLSQNQKHPSHLYKTFSKSTAFKNKRILIAEDHPVNRTLLGQLMAEFHLSCVFACTGQEAIEKWLGHTAGYFDLILMDIYMPQMDGISAAYSIRNTNHADAASIPIIAMTSDESVQTHKDYKQAGFNAILLKPISNFALYSTLLSQLCTL